ncbi:MAG: DNA alkylation repair protein [Tannerellaceae bacterium]|nr:DNA alkylation repair protein [Tannerellaceae bacterium]
MQEEILKNIRVQLRRAMNGIVSTSMREKGIDYKLNFGVSLSKIREIASRYEKNADLARVLWQEDVREMKILATLIYPAEEFTKEEADKWTSEIRHQEIAELYTLHLLQSVPFAPELAACWITRTEGFFPVTGFLLFVRLFNKGVSVSPECIQLLLKESKIRLDDGVSRTQRAALLALKRYGRQSHSQAEEVLAFFSDYVDSTSSEKREFYEDLKFEFEYYL